MTVHLPAYLWFKHSEPVMVHPYAIPFGELHANDKDLLESSPLPYSLSQQPFLVCRGLYSIIIQMAGVLQCAVLQ
jgi:hypothetical protein